MNGHLCSCSVSRDARISRLKLSRSMISGKQWQSIHFWQCCNTPHSVMSVSDLWPTVPNRKVNKVGYILKSYHILGVFLGFFHFPIHRVIMSAFSQSWDSSRVWNNLLVMLCTSTVCFTTVYLNFFTEFAENGSIFDYIHKKQKQPSLMQSLQWAKEVAEGTIWGEVKCFGINSTFWSCRHNTYKTNN